MAVSEYTTGPQDASRRFHQASQVQEAQGFLNNVEVIISEIIIVIS